MALAPTQNRYPPTGGSSGSQPPSNSTVTTTTGPRTDTQTSVGGSSSSSSYNKSWQEQIREWQNVHDRTTQTVTSKNMDDEAYGMLMAYLREQMRGGTPEDQERRRKIWEEIAANQTQRAQYSKEAAMHDSAAAAAANMAQALEQTLPAITAGVDSAGTSGSAMAALLSNKAAEAVSRNAAQLQLDAAISYGQIANQSSGIIAELLKINSEESQALLRGLEIAKGARTSQTTVTDRTVNTTGGSNRTGSERGSSTSTESNWANVTSNIGPQTNIQTTTYDLGNTGGRSGSISGGGSSSYTTPSSYRYGN